MITREEILAFAKEICVTPREELVAASVIDKIYDSIIIDIADDDPWAWVKTEYCALFKAKNPDRGGKVKESVMRLKAMFRARPEIRKEDVIATVKLYLSQTDSRFIRYPHYFLKKGQGTSAMYEFDDWYDKYLEAKKAGKGRTSVTNTMK
jgi:hypothetical protein